MNEIVMTACTVVGALGGFEFIKWLFNRKSRAEIEQAEAEAARVKAEADEYHLLKERIEFLNEQMLEKEKRFAEQTEHIRELNRIIFEHEKTRTDQMMHVRKLNEQLLGKEEKITELSSQVAELLAERAMKLCERKGCAQRQPQSGY